MRFYTYIISVKYRIISIGKGGIGMGVFNGWYTMGGDYWWHEIDEKNGWRIQQHKITGHYRVLDPEDRRQWSGGDMMTADRFFNHRAG
jgi:hypothetical protein